MTGRFVLLLFALAPIVIGDSIHSQARNVQPHYVPITVCEVSFHDETPNPKYISIDAEYVNAIPHGLFLIDRRCAKKALQIDFPDTGLDPSVELIKQHLSEIHRANGTFRGILKRDHVTRLYLRLDSVVNFRSADYLPELDPGEPIRLSAEGPTADTMPIKTSLCAIADASRRFDGKVVSFQALYVWGGVHRPALVDESCKDGSAVPEASERARGAEKLKDALGTGFVGTADKTIQATWIGRFHAQSKRDPLSRLYVTEIKDLTVEPK
jgi:hypothetical protein